MSSFELDKPHRIQKAIEIFSYINTARASKHLLTDRSEQTNALMTFSSHDFVMGIYKENDDEFSARTKNAREKLSAIYHKDPHSQKGIDAKRDLNRLIVGSSIIYTKSHGVYMPKSEYEPNLIRDTLFSEDKVQGGIRKTYPEIEQMLLEEF